ncbi:Uncharacterised protein [uncultured archaeon]|nr:Uncharacterised protein [uncultured archaeon]
MSEWDMSEWEKPYIDKYKIFVIDPGRVVAIMPVRVDDDPCGAINAGIKEAAKTKTGGSKMKCIQLEKTSLYESAP